jgi:hypothetical protein
MAYLLFFPFLVFLKFYLVLVVRCQSTISSMLPFEFGVEGDMSIDSGCSIFSRLI